MIGIVGERKRSKLGRPFELIRTSTFVALSMLFKRITSRKSLPRSGVIGQKVDFNQLARDVLRHQPINYSDAYHTVGEFQ
jgi:hypothetical protein